MQLLKALSISEMVNTKVKHAVDISWINCKITDDFRYISVAQQTMDF